MIHQQQQEFDIQQEQLWKEYKKNIREKSETKRLEKNSKNLERARNKLNKRRRGLNKYKISKGCYSCGYNENHKALCFSFDEKNLKKVTTVVNRSLKTLFYHIRKSKVSCFNCVQIKKGTNNGNNR